MFRTETLDTINCISPFATVDLISLFSAILATEQMRATQGWPPRPIITTLRPSTA